MSPKIITSILISMFISSSTAYAVTIPVQAGEERASQFDELVKEIDKSGNLLRYEGTEYDIQAYIKEINSTTTPDNVRLGVIVLGSNKDTKTNFVHSMGSIQFACAVDLSIAKSLNPGQLVSFHATIAQVQSTNTYNNTIGRNIENRLVVASCNLNNPTGNKTQPGSQSSPPQSNALQDCVVPKSKITTKGLEVLGADLYQTPDGLKLTRLMDNIPFWVGEKKGKWIKLFGTANSEPYKNGEIVGWTLESEINPQNRINCD
jgi:hypothetical protein